MVDRSADEAGTYVAPRRQPYGRAALLILAALVLGYGLSPYAAVTRFALAANAGQTQTILARIDLPALRAHFARQIVRAYVARNPQTRALDPLARQAVSSVAGGYVTAIIADYLTPETIAALLSRRRSAGRAGDVLGEGVALPGMDGLGNAWALLLASGFTGLSSFAVVPPPAAGDVEPYRLQFGITEWAWRLRAVDLPPSVINRLADELTARIDGKS